MAGEYEKADDIVNETHFLLTRWGFISQAEQLLRESIATLIGHSQAMAMGNLANIYQDRGEYEEAASLHKKVYRIFQKLNDRKNMAASRHQLGNIHYARGDYDAALVEYQASLEIKEQLGDKRGIASSTIGIGTLDEQRGDYESALEKYLKALTIFQALGSPDAQIAFNNIRGLREKWGRENFDAKWLEATGEKWPEEERDQD